MIPPTLAVTIVRNIGALEMLEITTEDEEKYRITRGMIWVFFLTRLFIYPLLWLFFRLMNRARAIGVENIPKEGGVMIAANHVSGVDTTLIPYFVANPFKLDPVLAVAKEELFTIPVIGFIVKSLGAFPVKRRARDLESMKRIVCHLRNYKVMIFPEGTRSKTGELLTGRPAVGWIAQNARPVVIPALVINTDKFFWPGRPRPWFGIPYTVVYGKPLDISRFYAMEEGKATSSIIVAEIMNGVAELKKTHRDLYMEPILLPDGSAVKSPVST
jgi:1-acyl-sn-glycerol-3-phosphate acyltransferase